MRRKTASSPLRERNRVRQRGAVFVEALIVAVLLVSFLTGIVTVRDAYANKLATLYDAREVAWRVAFDGCPSNASLADRAGSYGAAIGTALRELWDAFYEADQVESWGAWLAAAKALGPVARELLGGEDLSTKSAVVRVEVGQPRREVVVMKTTTSMGCNTVAQNIGTRTDMVREQFELLRSIFD
jgi:hypothetical protein